MERVKYPLKNNSILSCSYKSLTIVLLRIYETMIGYNLPPIKSLFKFPHNMKEH